MAAFEKAEHTEKMEASNTLFVADLPSEMKESDLSDIFRHLRGYQTSRLRTDKSARVVGFVEFELPEHAAGAKEMLDGQRVNGLAAPLRMQFAKAMRATAPRPPMPAQKRARDDEHVDMRSPPAPMHAEMRGYVGDSRAYEPPPRAVVPPLPPMPPGYPPGAVYDPRIQPLVPLVPPMHYSAGGPPELLAMPIPADASCTLYVENVPIDATQRELSHIFRPYAGFQSLRLIPKEAKRPNEPRRWLCFAEFDNKFHATAARNNVQGYRMDKSDTRGLGCDFAKPGRGPPAAAFAPRAADGDGRERDSGLEQGGGGNGNGGRREGEPQGYERERPVRRERDEYGGRGRDERGGGRRDRREDGSELSDDGYIDQARPRRGAEHDSYAHERNGRADDSPARGGREHRGRDSGAASERRVDAWPDVDGFGVGGYAAVSEPMEERSGDVADPHTVPFSLDDDEQM